MTYYALVGISVGASGVVLCATDVIYLLLWFLAWFSYLVSIGRGFGLVDFIVLPFLIHRLFCLGYSGVAPLFIFLVCSCSLPSIHLSFEAP